MAFPVFLLLLVLGTGEGLGVRGSRGGTGAGGAEREPFQRGDMGIPEPVAS